MSWRLAPLDVRGHPAILQNVAGLAIPQRSHDTNTPQSLPTPDKLYILQIENTNTRFKVWLLGIMRKVCGMVNIQAKNPRTC